MLEELFGEVGGAGVLLDGEGSLGGIWIADGGDAHGTVADQRGELSTVRPLPDVAETDDADADHGVAVPLARAVA